jgi:chitin disaccharide deacetylase
VTQPLTAFALCADDFAISPGVSRGICELMAQNRLYAASCLTVSRFWPEHAGWMAPYAGRRDIGLHLALTNFTPLAPANSLARDGQLPGLRRLIVGALTGQLPRAEIRDELLRQYDAFATAFGRPPDYVDGHHHVHQFPVIRDIVLELVAKQSPRPCLRLSDEPLRAVWKRNVTRGRAAVITLLGLGCRRRARALGLRMNTRFAGVYDFSPQFVYRDVFRKYISGAPKNLAVMCHPGHVDADLAALDSTVDSRPRELAYFAGADFPADLAEAGMALTRFTTICGPGTSAAAH